MKHKKLLATSIAVSLTLLVIVWIVLPSFAPSHTEITVPGVSQKGILDTFLALDPSTGRIWMSCSAVNDSIFWSGRNTWIYTRLAYSDTNGSEWTDAGIMVNSAVDVTLSLPAPYDAGTLVHEVSTLVNDQYDPDPQGRWKMIWHQYLLVNGIRAFDHGWISIKTAPNPTGP
ncbi:MAG: hypothetical protein RBG13Loki_4149 [Promethearchaeota archaeon CR_4]|nr:MAG: hypothetical protein RBG13Loki_4149 [Candidatus Lokiarchaeota archaeon CR_4]